MDDSSFGLFKVLKEARLAGLPGSRGDLSVSFKKYSISNQEAPKRILTEQTITNLKVHHEGRLDALLEWAGRQYGVLDWKTGNLDPIRSGGYDQWQMISNVFLANYRYHGDEDDFTGLRFAKGIYYQGSHNFRMPPSHAFLASV